MQDGQTEPRRWRWVGSRDAVQAALAAELGGPPIPFSDGADPNDADVDLVIVDALAGPPATASLPGGHVFAGVRALKRTPGLRVFVVVDDEDELGPQLARFCLADGVLRFFPDTGTLDLAELDGTDRAAQTKRPSVDALLGRIERDFAASSQESTVARLLRFESENRVLQSLQDPETGLFDGPYATWKLDEEWKRARRFHQPLSLVLLDLGEGLDALASADRAAVLVDAASVFLNECRDIDVLARFSPTTFLFLLPGTGTDGAEILAQRMLQDLEARLPANAGLELAAGVATAPSSHIPDRKAFLLVAEACLRRAREVARNSPGASRVATTWQ
ncbi:MAG: GGDEF domain-containing protein [Planctomycetes bacterium]|nr:GGDEF domain-containing protein [Planctomycetota bacterium]